MVPWRAIAVDALSALSQRQWCVQVSRLQASQVQVRQLQQQLSDRDRELDRLRADLEAALREEILDSDPARLRAAQQRVAELERDLADKEVKPAMRFFCP
jgi:predicted RNase H-like nuclease (RuvC/YqgF family)